MVINRIIVLCLFEYENTYYNFNIIVSLSIIFKIFIANKYAATCFSTF